MIGRLTSVLFLALPCICLQTSFGRERQNADLPGNAGPGPVAIVGGVKVIPRPEGLSIEIAVSAPVVPTSNRLTNPDRLVVDFPGCELRGENQQIPVNHGPVQGLRLSRFRVHPLVTRLVVDSKEPLAFQLKPDGKKVVIEITFAKAVSVAAASEPKPVSVEDEPAEPDGSSMKQPEPAASSRSADSRPTAYTLQAKAKALTVEDLQPLEDKANAGDPEAQTTLALAYHAGNLLKRDDAEALRLLHKAADQKFMAAQESLGIFSETGIGAHQPNAVEALDWYKKAVRQGSLDAATNIGLMYAEGRGVPRDPAQAVIWLRQAAEGGDGPAQYNLALIFSRGNGIPKDDKECLHWLTAAADQNVVPALLDLAMFYMHPPDSTAADVGRGIRYYEKAADLGSGRAQAILGSIFARGVLVKPDYEQSVKWFRMAAAQGQADGQFGLGVRYALGQGVSVDLQEARRLFTAAASQGQPEAQYDLAMMCEDGKGAPPDRSLATHYYQLAADQGLPKAQFRLGRLLATTAESSSDRVSAYKWLMLAQDSVKESSPALSDLRKSMSADEIAEAERKVDNWRLARHGTRQ